jgi:hypothetical protein
MGSVAGISKDIVIIDSSDAPKLEEIKKYIATEKRSDIHVYHTVALSLVEVLRPYGYSKCKNNWVLHLDTDEKISDELKKDINTIINSGNAAAYAIKRYEDREKGVDSPFFTWQIRLYDKRRIHYFGKLHEQPLVSGIVEKLDKSEYYMLHLQRKTGQGEYSRLEKFQRLTYLTLKMRLLDETSKLFMSKDRQTGGLGKDIIVGSVDLFRKLQLKKETEEISSFEYFLYYLLKTGMYNIKQRKFNPIKIINPANIYTTRIKTWQKERDSEIDLRLSTIIEKEGIIKYLGFDNPHNVDKITKKYLHSGLSGTTLLVHLLTEKCRKELHLPPNE